MLELTLKWMDVSTIDFDKYHLIYEESSRVLCSIVYYKTGTFNYAYLNDLWCYTDGTKTEYFLSMWAARAYAEALFKKVI